MKATIRLVVAFMIVGAAAVLVLLYTERRTPPSTVGRASVNNAIFIPEAGTFAPSTATSPAGLWLAERIARGLYRRESNGALPPDLADGPPTYALTLFLKPNGVVRMPSGDRLTAKNIDNYFLPMRSVANSPVSAVLRIEQVDGEIRIAIDPITGFGDDEILEILSLRRGDTALAIRTEFAISTHLRKDIRRRDGTRLTARDVASSLEALRSVADRSSMASLFRRVREIRASDDETLTILCDGVSRNALALLTMPAVTDPSRSTVACNGKNSISDAATGHAAAIVPSGLPTPGDGERTIAGKTVKTAVIFNLRVPHLNKEGLRRRMRMAATGTSVKGISPFHLRLMVDGSDGGERSAAEEIARRWKDSGIEVEIVALVGGEVAARLNERRFEVCLRSIPSNRLDLYAGAHSSQSQYGGNYSGYSNAETDRLLERFDRTLNRAAADALEANIAAIVGEDVPWFVLDNERPLVIRARDHGLAILDALTNP